MNDVMIYSVISIGSIGIAAAVVLYFVAQRFKVIEDPKIASLKEKAAIEQTAKERITVSPVTNTELKTKSPTGARSNAAK